MEKKARWIAVSLLVCLVILAAVLRFLRLDALSIWYDEGWSLYFARLGPIEALREIIDTADPHPPGYYMLLLAWMRIWGYSSWSARALSALLGVLTVPAIFFLGRELYDHVTGFAAAALLAIAPSHVIYSQEARMYPLLGLCTVTLFALYIRYAHHRARWRRYHWVLLIVTQSLALYTHFFSVFILFSLNLWLLITLYSQKRQRDWQAMIAWMRGQAVIALTFVPWLALSLSRVSEYTTGSTYTPPLLHFMAEVWSFLLSGQIDLLGPNIWYARVAFTALGLIILGIGAVWWRGRARWQMVYLNSQIVIPFLGIYTLTHLRPGFHSRYLLMLLFPLLALVAHLIRVLARDRFWGCKLGALTILTAWLAASLMGGHLALATNPWRDDARSTAAFLRTRMPPGSAILAAYPGWELNHYLEESDLDIRFWDMHALRHGIVDELTAFLEGRPQAAYVRWRQSDTDHTGQIAYTLAREGYPLSKHHFPAYTVSLYALNTARPEIKTCQNQVRFGPLLLVDAEIAETVPVDGVVTLMLRWHLDREVSQDIKVALFLKDVRGRTVAQQDLFLRQTQGFGTAQWPPNQTVTNYYTLSLPAGIAPLVYDLALSVYPDGDLSGFDVTNPAGAPAGKLYTLCQVQLTPERQRETPRQVDREAHSLLSFPEPVEAAPGLALAAYKVEPSIVRTGDRLSVLLEWHNVSQESLPSFAPTLRLTRSGVPVTEAMQAPVYGAYPTELWTPGEIVLDWRDLIIPPETESGPAEIQLQVANGPPISLGMVDIEAVARDYEPPAMQHRAEVQVGSFAILAGYDLSASTASAGENLAVTLYWKALDATPDDLVVFTHLLTLDNRLIAQHDGSPALGNRPTTGWAAGEYIRDQHTLQWLDTTYQGPARIQVGLYDPVTGQRIVTPSGDSHIELPEQIIVE